MFFSFVYDENHRLTYANNRYKVPTRLDFTPESPIVSVALSAYVGALVTESGQLHTWGRAKAHGALLLGDGTDADRSTPAHVPLNVRFLFAIIF